MIENESNIRLMDLGIARMSGGNKFSAFGFIGTPQYSAPEQILRDKNSRVQINASTDIYELGITFYELLAGSNPFDCQTEAESLSKQMKEPLPVNDKIPKRLMQVLWKATEKEQDKRFQTANEFKSAILEAIQPEVSMDLKIQSWIEEHLVSCLYGALAIVAIIILLIFI
jgi:serine/threonine-protein kinase